MCSLFLISESQSPFDSKFHCVSIKFSFIFHLILLKNKENFINWRKHISCSTQTHESENNEHKPWKMLCVSSSPGSASWHFSATHIRFFSVSFARSFTPFHFLFFLVSLSFFRSFVYFFLFLLPLVIFVFIASQTKVVEEEEEEEDTKERNYSKYFFSFILLLASKQMSLTSAHKVSFDLPTITTTKPMTFQKGKKGPKKRICQALKYSTFFKINEIMLSVLFLIFEEIKWNGKLIDLKQ